VRFKSSDRPSGLERVSDTKRRISRSGRLLGVPLNALRCEPKCLPGTSSGGFRASIEVVIEIPAAGRALKGRW
jgi:hypothetical protein